MSPTRRSQTLQHQQQNQQSSQSSQLSQQSVSQKEQAQQTPAKKSVLRGNILTLRSQYGSTAATTKDGNKSNGNSNANSAYKDAEKSQIKDLKIQGQKSQPLQQTSSYNLRSSSNIHSVKLLQVKANDSERGESQSVSVFQSPSKEIQPFDPNEGKENIRYAQSPDAKISNLFTNEISDIQSQKPLHNIQNNVVRANKTLNLKNTHNQITTNNFRGCGFKQPRIYEEDKKLKSSQKLNQEIRFRFETQRLNLPRGKVIRCSPQSSAYGSKRNSQSPVKLPKNMPPIQEAPKFQQNVDYFKEYWRMYFQNESIVGDIEQTAHSNYKTQKKIYNLEDYYEHYLVPQMFTYPHKFLHRLKQQQIQKQQQQQKLILQQKQQQELMLQMKSKSVDNQLSPNKNSSNSSGGVVSGSSSNNEHSSPHHRSSSNHNDESSSGVPQSSKDQQNLKPHHILSLAKDRAHKRKKHLRRTAAEIEREFICPYAECGKFYGSEGSLNLHIKIKHNGGNKTERERLAKTLVQAYINGSISKEIDSLDLNLPPGALQKAVKKAGLVQQVSESEIFRQITATIQQHQVVAQAAIGVATGNGTRNSNSLIHQNSVNLSSIINNPNSILVPGIQPGFISNHSSSKSQIDLGISAMDIDLINNSNFE